MPVAIVGMHRSGTSLVAQMLARTGLYLGRADDLYPAAADNADGYWEHVGFHRLNESLLAEFGGGWDSPPELPRRWDDDARLRPFRAEAERLVGELGGNDPWGWKDPRTSLTLALWNDLVPELRVVLCVRNPLEVARSLNRRGMFSYTTALKLWRTYNRRVLEASTAEQRIVTEYDGYFARPKEELRRLLSFLGLDVSEPTFEHAAAACRDDLRHVRFGVADLRTARVAPDVVELYTWLCSQAAATSGTTEASPPPAAAPTATRLVDDRAVEAVLSRQQQPEPNGDGSRSVARAAHELVAGEDAGDETRAAYADRVRRITELVRSETPPGAVVAVVSKGDDGLLEFEGRRGMHFPQIESGSFSGAHPASGLPAVAHLEVLRAKGVGYFLLPADSLWWLDHYAELRRHLAARFRQVVSDGDTCVLFALRAEDLAGPDSRDRLAAPVMETSGISIIVAVGADTPHAEACLASLDETLPHGFDGEIVLVGSTERTLERFARRREGTVIVPSPAGSDTLEALNLGAREAGGETLVFLDTDLLLLPGWLGPLVDVLHDRGDAGAAGCRLLFADGSLEEAGGTVFSDGSALRFGYGHVDPEAGLFDYVHRVDYCSRLLATPREVFLDLGGFDRRLGSELYGVVDYCFGLRRRGLHVYFQPAGTAVDLAGRTGRREAGAVEQPTDGRFVDKWESLLEAQPARPGVVDRSTLHALAAAHA